MGMSAHHGAHAAGKIADASLAMTRPALGVLMPLEGLTENPAGATIPGGVLVGIEGREPLAIGGRIPARAVRISCWTSACKSESDAPDAGGNDPAAEVAGVGGGIVSTIREGSGAAM